MVMVPVFSLTGRIGRLSAAGFAVMPAAALPFHDFYHIVPEHQVKLAMQRHRH